MSDDSVQNSPRSLSPRVFRLSQAIRRLGTYEAVELLEGEEPEAVAQLLAFENPALADELLWELPSELRERVLSAAPAEQREQWTRNHSYPEDSIGRLMDPPIAVLSQHLSVEEVIEKLRSLVKRTLVTYGWVVDDQGKLVGVLAFRELLFAKEGETLADVMVKEPFSLRPEMSLTDGMKAALERHYPAYPVCDDGGRLLGIVRGQRLFEQQAFELSAQAGTLVGVEKEERLGTPWQRSLRFRHPWLQLNLLTAFIAAAVVGIFEGTLERLVVLAVFLPVLAGQSGNTGCQALAVALRGLTLGELNPGVARRLVFKEGWLGFLNGTLVGLSAALGMFAYATMQDSDQAFNLALVVFMAMVGSCTVSGVTGAIVPLALARLGADPATASSIFLTTATDVVSMGMFLGLATVIIL